MNVEALQKLFEVDKKTIERCIAQTAKENGVSKQKVEDVLVRELYIDPMIGEIIRKFKLGELDASTFTQYVDHIHRESRLAFVRKVLKGSKEYLQNFLDTEFESFGDKVFGEGGEEKIDHRDLYDVNRVQDPTKYTLIYQALLIKLRELSAEERKGVMENVFGFSSNSKDKLERRRIFYEDYKRHITSLSQSQLEKFIEALFSKDENPFSSKEEKEKEKGEEDEPEEGDRYDDEEEVDRRLEKDEKKNDADEERYLQEEEDEEEDDLEYDLGEGLEWDKFAEGLAKEAKTYDLTSPSGRKEKGK